MNDLKSSGRLSPLSPLTQRPGIANLLLMVHDAINLFQTMWQEPMIWQHEPTEAEINYENRLIEMSHEADQKIRVLAGKIYKSLTGEEVQIRDERKQVTDRTIERLKQSTEKSEITINCIYFKKSGKFYANGSGQFRKSLFENCNYPSEYGRILLSLGALPGLRSGTWSEGAFTVEVEDLYTELVCI
jgi:hypothetical protein